MIVKYDNLLAIREKNLKNKIALFKGTFDLFHY